MLRAMDDFDVRNMLQEAKELERKKWFIAARHRQEKKQIKQDQSEDELLDLVSNIVLADPIEVAEFRAELDTYDALTVEALLENKKILEGLYSKRDGLLEDAHKLDNGIRVFKSINGKDVYDEHGANVSPDIIHPDEIADHHPKAETYLDTLRKIKKHERVDQRLIDYQEKLDEAKERLDNGNLTQDEFNELRETLQKEMPIEVRRKLPDYDPSQETSLKSDFSSATKLSVLTPKDMSIDLSLVQGLN